METQREFKDSRLKYVEMPKEFSTKASEVRIESNQHFRVCQQLAVRLANERPKTKQEFEKVEYLKDFVIKSAQLNEKVLDLLTYTHSLLIEIANDYETVGVALEKDTLRFQSETIEVLRQQRDDLVKDLYEERKAAISGGHSKPTQ